MAVLPRMPRGHDAGSGRRMRHSPGVRARHDSRNLCAESYRRTAGRTRRSDLVQCAASDTDPEPNPFTDPEPVANTQPDPVAEPHGAARLDRAVHFRATRRVGQLAGQPWDERAGAALLAPRK